MAVHWRLVWRRWHRWVAIFTAIPFLLVILTGILLQLKKDLPWIQPPTQRGSATAPALSLPEVLKITQGVPEAGVQGWDDIVRIDVQPSRGLIKVTCQNRWEVQLDATNGQVLQVAYRRSDLIESLHDGSWFSDHAKLWVFLPSGILVLTLWCTGIYLFVLPWWVKSRRPHRQPAA